MKTLIEPKDIRKGDLIRGEVYKPDGYDFTAKERNDIECFDSH